MNGQTTEPHDQEIASAWHPQDIKAAIWKRGQTMAGLARKNGLAEGTCRSALTRDDSPRADKVISEFLGVTLHELWPDRYDESGGRIRHVRTDITHEREPAHRLSREAV